MSIFSRDDDSLDDDGPIFGGANRTKDKRTKLELAKEISSGLVSGLFERDEEVWDLIKKLEESE